MKSLDLWIQDNHVPQRVTIGTGGNDIFGSASLNAFLLVGTLRKIVFAFVINLCTKCEKCNKKMVVYFLDHRVYKIYMYVVRKKFKSQEPLPQ